MSTILFVCLENSHVLPAKTESKSGTFVSVGWKQSQSFLCSASLSHTLREEFHH